MHFKLWYHTYFAYTWVILQLFLEVQLWAVATPCGRSQRTLGLVEGCGSSYIYNYVGGAKWDEMMPRLVYALYTEISTNLLYRVCMVSVSTMYDSRNKCIQSTVSLVVVMSGAALVCTGASLVWHRSSSSASPLPELPYCIVLLSVLMCINHTPWHTWYTCFYRPHVYKSCEKVHVFLTWNTCFYHPHVYKSCENVHMFLMWTRVSNVHTCIKAVKRYTCFYRPHMYKICEKVHVFLMWNTCFYCPHMYESREKVHMFLTVSRHMVASDYVIISAKNCISFRPVFFTITIYYKKTSIFYNFYNNNLLQKLVYNITIIIFLLTLRTSFFCTWCPCQGTWCRCPCTSRRVAAWCRYQCRSCAASTCRTTPRTPPSPTNKGWVD